MDTVVSIFYGVVRNSRVIEHLADRRSHQTINRSWTLLRKKFQDKINERFILRLRGAGTK